MVGTAGFANIVIVSVFFTVKRVKVRVKSAGIAFWLFAILYNYGPSGFPFFAKNQFDRYR